jgi:hypothetical protein
MKALREKHARKRGDVIESSLKVAPSLSHKENLATQISEEIQERCDYLDEMMAMGASESEMSTVKREISKRVAELKVIERKI